MKNRKKTENVTTHHIVVEAQGTRDVKTKFTHTHTKLCFVFFIFSPRKQKRKQKGKFIPFFREILKF